MEIKFFRTILNKINDRIRNTNIRFEPGVDEIKNDIQKGRLRWFEHVIQKTGYLRKCYIQKWREMARRKNQNQMEGPN